MSPMGHIILGSILGIEIGLTLCSRIIIPVRVFTTIGALIIIGYWTTYLF